MTGVPYPYGCTRPPPYPYTLTLKTVRAYIHNMATAIIEDMNGETMVTGFSALEEDADEDLVRVWYEDPEDDENPEYYEEYQYSIITKVVV